MVTTVEVCQAMPTAVPVDRAAQLSEMYANYANDHATILESAVRDTMAVLEIQFELGPTDLDPVKTLIALP